MRNTELVTGKQAAKMLEVSLVAVYNYVAHGKLVPMKKSGRYNLFALSDIKNLKKQLLNNQNMQEEHPERARFAPLDDLTDLRNAASEAVSIEDLNSCSREIIDTIGVSIDGSEIRIKGATRDCAEGLCVRLTAIKHDTSKLLEEIDNIRPRLEKAWITIVSLFLNIILLGSVIYFILR